MGSYYTTAADKAFCDKFVEENRERLRYAHTAPRAKKWRWDGDVVSLGTLWDKLDAAASAYGCSEKVQAKTKSEAGIRALLDYIKWQVMWEAPQRR